MVLTNWSFIHCLTNGINLLLSFQLHNDINWIFIHCTANGTDWNFIHWLPYGTDWLLIHLLPISTDCLPISQLPKSADSVDMSSNSQDVTQDMAATKAQTSVTNPTTYPSFFFESPGVTAVGEVVFWAPLLSGCLADLPLRKRRNDSLKDFLNDLRREIGASPAPDRSGTLTQWQWVGSFGYIFIPLTMSICKTRTVVTEKSVTIYSRIPICFWIEDFLTLGSPPPHPPKPHTNNPQFFSIHLRYKNSVPTLFSSLVLKSVVTTLVSALHKQGPIKNIKCMKSEFVNLEWMKCFCCSSDFVWFFHVMLTVHLNITL